MTKKTTTSILQKTTNNTNDDSDSAETISPSLASNDIFNWSIKTMARSPNEIFWTQLGTIFICALPMSFCIWLGRDVYLETPSDALYLVYTFAGAAIYIIALGVRQKTIYNYTIKTDRAHLEYYLHYPDFASSFFKGIAITVILLFVMVAILTGSMLFLIGPVAMAFIAAIKLLNWENPIHHEQSLPWGEYNFVTVDRKRLMIITHRTDVTLGFEARFQHEVLFNKYLNFLHTVLPSTAEFTEKAWKW
ncbi:permease [Pseudomonas syringae]|uniref:permease n=2 Tax=Pseudomonas syringae TaxID=317 RepID=UPI001F1F123A|nr:permease [Pseudomonas syringae]